MALAGAAVYAKLVPQPNSACNLIQLNHLQATFCNSKSTLGSLPGAAIYLIAQENQNIPPELRKSYFSVKYDDKADLFSIFKEPGSLSLMVSSPGPESLLQWNEVAPSSSVYLKQGSIIHLDAGAFVSRWRWVTRPSNSSGHFSQISPFNARQSLQLVIDDQIFNFPNASMMSQSLLSSQGGVSASASTIDDLSSMPPPSKKRKIVRQGESICQTLEEVQRDKDTGQPKMPIALSGGVTLLDLGSIDAIHEKFHNNRYIFPVGFRSRRMYWSLVDPSRRCAYTQEIRSVPAKTKQGTDTFEPSFVLVCEDAPDQPIASNTPSGVWSIVRERNKAQREEKAGKKLSTNISGQDQFGLSNSVVKALIEQLPNAKLCKRYWEAASTASSPSVSLSNSTDQMDL